MGTTVVSTLFLDDALIVGHVGDSRLYRYREGMFDQMTEDHSLLNDYIKMKHLSPEEIAAFPHKNVIVRALGMKESVKVDTRFEMPQEGDVVLLCTDGLAGPCSDQEIFEIVDSTPDLSIATQSLIHAANERGGPDNVTCVLARWIV